MFLSGFRVLLGKVLSLRVDVSVIEGVWMRSYITTLPHFMG